MTPNGHSDRSIGPAPPRAPAVNAIDAAFEAAFGHPLAEALDLGRWRVGRDPAAEFQRLQQEFETAADLEGEYEADARRLVLPKLAFLKNAPRCAGHYPLELEDIARVQREVLFAGGVECCDGFSDYHDSLALTAYALGVSLVSYAGDGGSWTQRLYRHDLRQQHANPADRLLELLQRRSERGGLHERAQDQLSELARRALMSYAERAVLGQAKAPWRLGHGSPAPHELLTGGGSADLLIRSLRIIRGIVDHGRFVYVASEPDARDYLTLGQALRPGEFAIVAHLGFLLDPFLDKAHPPGGATVDAAWEPGGGPQMSTAQWLIRFRDEVAPKVVVGVYRAGLLAPPHLFYAHEDYFETAAAIAIADSTADDRRGFPMLIDLADRVCKGIFAGGGLTEMVKDAYLQSGAPFRYLSERALRP